MRWISTNNEIPGYICSNAFYSQMAFLLVVLLTCACVILMKQTKYGHGNFWASVLGSFTTSMLTVENKIEEGEIGAYQLDFIKAAQERELCEFWLTLRWVLLEDSCSGFFLLLFGFLFFGWPKLWKHIYVSQVWFMLEVSWIFGPCKKRAMIPCCL